MPERRAKKPTAPRKTAAKAATPKKAPAKRVVKPLPAPAPERALPAQTKPALPAPTAEALPSGQVCPRCGSAKFGPEQRIRAEGSRTVRYTILVCERGHTFARPVTKGS